MSGGDLFAVESEVLEALQAGDPGAADAEPDPTPLRRVQRHLSRRGPFVWAENRRHRPMLDHRSSRRR